MNAAEFFARECDRYVYARLLLPFFQNFLLSPSAPLCFNDKNRRRAAAEHQLKKLLEFGINLLNPLMELALQSLLKLPEHLMEGLLARRKVLKLAREKAVTLADFKRGTLKVKRLEFLRARATRGLQLIGLPLLFARKTFRLRNARTHGIGFRAQSFLSGKRGAERALQGLLLVRKSRERSCLAALYAPCKLPDKNSYLFPNSGKRRLDGCKIAFLFTARDERLNVLYERTDVRERYRCGVCLCSLALAPHLYHALNSPKFAGKFCALIPRLSKLSAQACESPFVVALCRTSP